jgi:hypothetical protein
MIQRDAPSLSDHEPSGILKTMRTRNRESFEVACPCCGARLTIDPMLGKVLHSRQSEKQTHGRDLDHIAQLLESDAARRDALFRESMAEQKIKPELLERKFEEALKKTSREPALPPLRDLDLD